MSSIAHAPGYESTPTKRVIHWGGILKGAAIVTAVVIAAAVAWWAVSAYVAPAISSAMTAATGSPPGTLSYLAGTAVNAAAEAGTWLMGQGSSLWSSVVEYWNDIPTSWNLTNSLASNGVKATLTGGAGVAAAAANISTAAQVVAAGAVVAGGIHAALPAMNHLQFTSTVPDHSAMLATQGAHAHMHDMTHDLSHHAVEGSHPPRAALAPGEQPRGGWMNKFSEKASFANHAEAARASKPAARNIPTPSGSFADDLTAQTAQLTEANR